MRFQNIGDDAGEDGKERTTAVCSVGDDGGEDVKDVRQVHLPPAAKRIVIGVATKAVHVVGVRVAVHGLICPVIGALFGNLVDCHINWREKQRSRLQSVNGLGKRGVSYRALVDCRNF